MKYEWGQPECSVGSTTLGSDGKLYCRCVVCARCGEHTGNSHQGHCWTFCTKTGQLEKPHFCCPDLPCDYEAEFSYIGSSAA